MLRWIERTRKKPKEVRDQYAFAGAVGVTALIALIWLVSLPTHFAETEVDTTEEREAVGAFSRFIRDAKTNMASVFSAASDGKGESGKDESAPEGASSSRVVVPELSGENIDSLKEKQEEEAQPQPRTVLIATSSRAGTSSASTTADEE